MSGEWNPPKPDLRAARPVPIGNQRQTLAKVSLPACPRCHKKGLYATLYRRDEAGNLLGLVPPHNRPRLKGLKRAQCTAVGQEVVLRRAQPKVT